MARNKGNVSTDTGLEDIMLQWKEGNKDNDIQKEYGITATHLLNAFL